MNNKNIFKTCIVLMAFNLTYNQVHSSGNQLHSNDDEILINGDEIFVRSYYNSGSDGPPNAAPVRPPDNVTYEEFLNHPNAVQRTVLHTAVELNDEKKVKDIIESIKNPLLRAAFINAQDGYGNTAIHLAAKLESDGIYRLLNMYNQHLKDNSGQTAQEIFYQLLPQNETGFIHEKPSEYNRYS